MRADAVQAIATHQTLDLSVFIDAPFVIVPEDVRREDAMAMILDFGELRVNSDLVDAKPGQCVTFDCS